MKRSLLALAALVITAMPAAAQHPEHPGVSADSMARLMNGTWEGPFTTDHGPTGTMSVVISHDSAGVNATMQISAHMDVAPSPLTNIKHENGKVTWTQETAGMSCSGAAAMDANGAFAGTLDCGHAKLTFTLTKSAAAKSR